MSTVKIVSIVPSFNVAAKGIVSAMRKADAIAVKTSDMIVQTVQQYLDAASVAGVPRDNQGVKALGSEIRNCQVMLDAIAIGTFEKKTITEYAQGAMRAYFHSVPYTATLKNDPAYKIPGADGTVKASPSGAVTKTTKAALYKTISKALGQARLLGMTEQAADLLDFCLDNFEGFAETTSDDSADVVDARVTALFADTYAALKPKAKAI
jgi:hypothetical protein